MEFKNALKTFFNCNYCGNLKRDAFSSQCGHSVCFICAFFRLENGKFTCSTCDVDLRKFSGPTYQQNFELNEALDLYRSAISQEKYASGNVRYMDYNHRTNSLNIQLKNFVGGKNEIIKTFEEIIFKLSHPSEELCTAM